MKVTFGIYLGLVHYVVIICSVLNVHYHKNKCHHGYFILVGMTECHSWLNCDDISRVEVGKIIGYGAVKNVHIAKWLEHIVVYNKLRNEKYEDDFNSGLELLINFSPSPYIVQLIGFCNNTNVIITEYHKFNNAVNVKHLLEKYEQDSIISRLKLCLNYAEIINYLHTSPMGIRVNCDSNDLTKLLTQLLITDDFALVLNDLDTLPEVKSNSSIICGPREIKSVFVAPEQRIIPKKNGVYYGYTEKTDIWKAANVCMYFIEGPNSEIIQYMLFNIHKECKSIDPQQRPSAAALVQVYKDVLQQMYSTHSEL